MNLNDRMRISDSDRDQVAAQLRDYYAEGRLTTEELDERVTAALSAKTAGDLRRLMSDLPSPAPAAGAPSGPGAQSYGAWPNRGPQWAGRPYRRRRGPRLLPILLLLFVAAILLPGGFVFFALLKVFLLFWLLVMVGGMIAGLVFRHKARRFFRDRASQWQGQNWRGPGWRGSDWHGPRDDW
ncbi:MAG TPA: DUF1707 domain-containing protein [Streptosporangiaceae bacterium]|jgi:hypothetical protein|nr:DUF1707 domain-containing protein [Streptosporangiaceae bacterium]